MCDASMLHALLLVKSCNIGCIIYPLASRAKSSACLLPTATGGQFSPCFIRIFWLLAFGKNGCVQLGDVFFLNSTPLSAFSVCWPPSKRGRSPPISLRLSSVVLPANRWFNFHPTSISNFLRPSGLQAMVGPCSLLAAIFMDHARAYHNQRETYVPRDPVSLGH